MPARLPYDEAALGALQVMDTLQRQVVCRAHGSCGARCSATCAGAGQASQDGVG